MPADAGRGGPGANDVGGNLDRHGLIISPTIRWREPAAPAPCKRPLSCQFGARRSRRKAPRSDRERLCASAAYLRTRNHLAGCRVQIAGDPAEVLAHAPMRPSTSRRLPSRLAQFRPIRQFGVGRRSRRRSSKWQPASSSSIQPFKTSVIGNLPYPFRCQQRGTPSIRDQSVATCPEEAVGNEQSRRSDTKQLQHEAITG